MTCFCQKDNVNANNITRMKLSEKMMLPCVDKLVTTATQFKI